MNLEDIRKTDDTEWLRYLEENTKFDTVKIKNQKDWLIKRVDTLSKKLKSSRESVVPLSDERDEYGYQNRELKDFITWTIEYSTDEFLVEKAKETLKF
ncbi:hypothetical protein AAGG74_15175 [Bacillus mexicanus]|uniref:hypothetical protein n=1 Tax=Bacillus mexicanus TaxID=2834415 RepID=UPI003D1F5CC1